MAHRKVLAVLSASLILASCDFVPETGNDLEVLTGSLRADHSSTLETGASGVATPVVLTFELNHSHESDLEFQVWSTHPDAVLVEPNFLVQAGEVTHLLSVLPNPAGSSVKHDQTVLIYVTGHGVRASASVTVINVDPIRATMNPTSIALAENGMQETMTVELSAPATEDVEFLIENPETGSLVAPGSVVVAAGTSSASFVVRALPDADTFDEQFSVSLRQVNGTDQTVELGTSFDVTITDDDPVDEVVADGSNPLVTFAGADTVWENGIPTADDTITLVLRPRPVQSVAFLVSTTDPDAVSILDLNGMPRSIFTIVPGSDPLESSVRFIVRARQDPDKHNELTSVYAISMVAGENPDNQNPLAGAYANLAASRQIRVMDDDILFLDLVRNSPGIDTLYVQGSFPADTAFYTVQLTGGVAPEGGLAVLVNTSNPDVALTRSVTTGLFISQVFIAEGASSAQFMVVPFTVASGHASPVTVHAHAVVPSSVSDSDYTDQDALWVANSAGEVLVLTLSAGSTTLDEDGGTASVTTVTATLSGNLSLGSSIYAIEISDPTAASANASFLFYPLGTTVQTFQVTALSDPDYLDESFQVRVIGGQGGQLVQAVLAMQVDDDDATLALAPQADRNLTEGDVESITVSLSQPVNANYGDLILALSSSNPSRLAIDRPSITIAEGQSSAGFNITAVENILNGDDTSVEVLVSGTNLGQATQQVIRVNIADNDTLVVLVLELDGVGGNTLQLTEGHATDSSAVVTARLTNGEGPIHFGVEISDPNKVATDSFLLYIPVGETEVSFNVFALPDPDPDNEIVEIRLLGGVNGQVLQAVLSVEVDDDDEVLAATLTPSQAPLLEGETLDFTVTLQQRVPLGYGPLVLAITSSNTDKLGHVDGVTSVVIAEGDSVAAFSMVGVVNEGLQEPYAAVVNVSGGNLGQSVTASATVLISDEDVLPAMTLTPVGGPTIVESTSTQVVVSLSGLPATHLPLLFGITISDPGALSCDSMTVYFSETSSSETILVTARPDADYFDEWVELRLSGTVHGILVEKALTLQVSDDDDIMPVTLLADTLSLAEGETTVVEVNLPQPVPAGYGALTLLLQSSDPNRLNFLGVTTATVPEGDSLATFMVFATVNEGLQPPAEVNVSVVGGNLGHLSVGEATFFIHDLDGRPDLAFAFLQGGTTLDEEDTVIVQVSLLNVPSVHLPIEIDVYLSDPNALWAETDQLFFASGNLAETLMFIARHDQDFFDEWATATFEGTVHGIQTSRQITFGILDNEDVLQASITPATHMMAEGDSVDLMIELSEPVPVNFGALTVLLQSSDLFRVTLDSSLVTFAEGESSTTVRARAVTNQGWQPPKQVQVVLHGGNIGQQVLGSATIVVSDTNGLPDVVLTPLGMTKMSEDCDSLQIAVRLVGLGQDVDVTPPGAPEVLASFDFEGAFLSVLSDTPDVVSSLATVSPFTGSGFSAERDTGVGEVRGFLGNQSGAFIFTVTPTQEIQLDQLSYELVASGVADVTVEVPSGTIVLGPEAVSSTGIDLSSVPPQSAPFSVIWRLTNIGPTTDDVVTIDNVTLTGFTTGSTSVTDLGPDSPVLLSVMTSDPSRMQTSVEGLSFAIGQIHDTFWVKTRPDFDFVDQFVDVKVMGTLFGWDVAHTVEICHQDEDTVFCMKGMRTVTQTGMLLFYDAGTPSSAAAGPTVQNFGVIGSNLVRESDQSTIFDLTDGVPPAAYGNPASPLDDLAEDSYVFTVTPPVGSTVSVSSVIFEQGGGNVSNTTHTNWLVQIDGAAVGFGTIPFAGFAGAEAHPSAPLDGPYATDFSIGLVPNGANGNATAGHWLIDNILVEGTVSTTSMANNQWVFPDAVGEGDTVKVDLSLNQVVPVGGGPLKLTLFNTNPAALFVRGDSNVVMIGEGDSTTCVWLVAPEDLNLSDEEVSFLISGSTDANWTVSYFQTVTVLDNDTLDVDCTYTSLGFPQSALVTETLRVFLRHDAPFGESVHVLIYPHDFDQVQMINLENGEFEVEYWLMDTSDTIYIGLIGKPNPSNGSFDDFVQILNLFADLQDRHTAVQIDADIRGEEETKIFPVTISPFASVPMTAGLSQSFASLPIPMIAATGQIAGVGGLFFDPLALDVVFFASLTEGDVASATGGFNNIPGQRDGRLVLRGYSSFGGLFGADLDLPQNVYPFPDIRSLPVGLGIPDGIGGLAQPPSLFAQLAVDNPFAALPVGSVVFATDFDGFTQGSGFFSGATGNTRLPISGEDFGDEPASGMLGNFTGSSSTTLNVFGLVPGLTYFVSFDLFIGGEWAGNDIDEGPDGFILSVNPTLIDTTFQNYHSSDSDLTIYTQNYSDNNLIGPGNFSAFEGAEVVNNDPDPDDRYQIQHFGVCSNGPILAFTATGVSAQIVFRSSLTNPDDEFWAIDNVVVSLPFGNDIAALGGFDGTIDFGCLGYDGRYIHPGAAPLLGAQLGASGNVANVAWALSVGSFGNTGLHMGYAWHNVDLDELTTIADSRLHIGQDFASPENLLLTGDHAYTPSFQAVNDSVVLTILDGDGGPDGLLVANRPLIVFGTEPASNGRILDTWTIGAMPTVMTPDTVVFLTDPSGTEIGDPVEDGLIARLVGLTRPSVDSVYVDCTQVAPRYLKGYAASWPEAINASTAAYISEGDGPNDPDVLVVIHTSDTIVVTTVEIDGKAADHIRLEAVRAIDPFTFEESRCVVVINHGFDGPSEDDRIELYRTNAGEEGLVASVVVGEIHDGASRQPLVLSYLSGLPVVMTLTHDAGVDWLTTVLFPTQPFNPIVRAYRVPGPPSTANARVVQIVGGSHVSVNGPGTDLSWGTLDDAVHVFTLPIALGPGADIRDIAVKPVTDLEGNLLNVQYVVHSNGIVQPNELFEEELDIDQSHLFTTFEADLRFASGGNGYLGRPRQIIGSFSYDDFPPVRLADDKDMEIETSLVIDHFLAATDVTATEIEIEQFQPSTLGQEFMLVFMPIDDGGFGNVGNAGNVRRIAWGVPFTDAFVQVFEFDDSGNEFFIDSESTTQEEDHGTVDLIDLDDNDTEDLTLVLSDHDQVTDKGILVRSSEPIGVWAFNSVSSEPNTLLFNTVDAYAVLPIANLGCHYVVAISTNSGDADDVGSYFVVAATENETRVRITPSENCPTSTSPDRPAGVEYEILLNRGQTYLLINTETGQDLSGSLIDADKPVAVFAGHYFGVLASSSGARDHMAVQMMPVETWGREFPIASAPGSGRARFKVVAAEDDTEVILLHSNASVFGNNPYTLDRGDVLDLSDSNFSADSAFVWASRNVMVVQFMGDNGPGEDQPWVRMVPSTRQYKTQYVIPKLSMPIQFTSSVAYEATVIFPADCDIDFEDGGSSFFIDRFSTVGFPAQLIAPGVRRIGNTRWYSARLSLSAGGSPETSGRLHATGDEPFMIWINGQFNQFGSDRGAFGYCGGFLMRPLHCNPTPDRISPP